MAIPDFQSLFLPLLTLLGDKQLCTPANARHALAEQFEVSEAEQAVRMPSGTPQFANRVAWTLTHLKGAALIESPARGQYLITARGQDLLAEQPERIDIRLLQRYPEYVEFRSRKGGKSDTDSFREDSDENGEKQNLPPEEALVKAYGELRGALVSEIKNQVKDCSPQFFEKLVIDLLSQMGYGWSAEEAGVLLGRSGDGGVDGLINEDKLGLEVIYVQAKRWNETVVGRPEIQKFAGALQGKRAKKGVFITTSSFSKDAQDYVADIEARIVLIDGRRLAELMFDHNLGVALNYSYEIKKLDSDYFLDE